MRKLLALMVGILGFGFLFVSPTFATSGTISLPNQYINRSDPGGAGILWTPPQYSATYTSRPYIDPFHYHTCANDGGGALHGVLYSNNDNSVVASGLLSTLGCDGWMAFQTVSPSAFQNNTPYYFIITDSNTGQTWRSPCFEDTGDDSQLVACSVAVSPLPNATLSEGGTYTGSGSFTDPNSTATSWTATVDYGDGSGVQPLTLSGTNFSMSHVYKDNGSYTVTVRIADNQGTIGSGTATVTVNNVAPSVGTITVTPSPAHINTAVTASASFTDPGALDTHTASWNWGDGNTTTGTVTESNGSGSVSNTHTYTSFGTYTITLTVTDKDTAGSNKTASVTVVKQITALAPATVWFSKNLLNIGLKLDLKAEVYKDATLVSSGEVDSVTVGTGGNPTSHTISFNSFSPVDFPAGSQLKVQVYARNACSGSLFNSGTANLYFNSGAQDSRFGATIGTTATTYHLLDGFLFGTTAGTSQKSISVAAGAKCSPFKSFGTWTVTP